VIFAKNPDITKILIESIKVLPILQISNGYPKKQNPLSMKEMGFQITAHGNLHRIIRWPLFNIQSMRIMLRF
jgi:hypothetical protein